MFWHGTNFGFALSDFCNLMLAKTMIVGTSAIFYNMNAAFSGGYFVQDFLFLIYNASSYGYYTFVEVSINKRYYQDAEWKLPFTMSEAYAYNRDTYMKGMMKRFMIFSAFVYFGGFCTYSLSYYSLQDGVNEMGKTESLWTVGLVMQMSLVIWVDTLIITNVKDMNTLMIVCLGILVI